MPCFAFQDTDTELAKILKTSTFVSQNNVNSKPTDYSWHRSFLLHLTVLISVMSLGISWIWKLSRLQSTTPKVNEFSQTRTVDLYRRWKQIEKMQEDFLFKENTTVRTQ